MARTVAKRANCGGREKSQAIDVASAGALSCGDGKVFCQKPRRREQQLDRITPPSRPDPSAPNSELAARAGDPAFSNDFNDYLIIELMNVGHAA